MLHIVLRHSQQVSQPCVGKHNTYPMPVQLMLSTPGPWYLSITVSGVSEMVSGQRLTR